MIKDGLFKISRQMMADVNASSSDPNINKAILILVVFTSTSFSTGGHSIPLEFMKTLLIFVLKYLSYTMIPEAFVYTVTFLEYKVWAV